MDFLHKAFSRALQPVESEVPPEILAEQELNRHGINQLASNTYQKLIEQKERELRESILVNYSRIKEVEKELGDLTVQLQVNVGPRKHALELLRLKIEKQNERLSKVRARHSAAKKALEVVEEELAREQAAKDQLSKELNLLVQESATAQLAKLEELKNHLEALNRGMKMATLAAPSDGTTSGSPGPSHAPAAVCHVAGSGDSSGDMPTGPNPFSSVPPELVAAPSVMPPGAASTPASAGAPAQVINTADSNAAATPAAGASQGGGEQAATTPRRGKREGGGPGTSKKDEQQKKLLAEVAAARAASKGGNGSLEGLAVSLPDLGPTGRVTAGSAASSEAGGDSGGTRGPEPAGNRSKASRFSGFDV